MMENKPASDAAFTGSVPALYDALLVPMLFEPYAADVVRRLSARPPKRLLEVAAGTGAVTRAMAAGLPDTTAITATDLNPGMIERGRGVGTSRAVDWRVADALQLPFDDESFDAVVCQFGLMFFPDKPAGHREVRRVLVSGGIWLFSVWDRIEENEFPAVVMDALARIFPDDPPRFLIRTPHGHFDREALARDLVAGGFTEAPHIDVVA
ncbi:MAG TPA: methyltransferase domain-containing protein, partial [Candidatus Eisenbacteria bacterium]